LSYGHNVEFAWLMLRAEDVLGQPRSWTHFHNHVTHALKYGTDPVRGGVYNRGQENDPATDRDKVWWVQAEMLAALAHGLAHSPEHPGYRDALGKLWLWIHSAQADPKTGIWLDTVRADGTPKSTALAHNWKANYHDVRALHLFAEAFGR
jgi:mannobiose 2-epimerase